MRQLQKFVFLAAVPMVLLLPAWLVLGRVVFGVSGWGIFLSLLLAVPLMVGLLILAIMTRTRKIASQMDALLLSALYLVVFLYGFFAIDSGDTSNSMASVATVIFGQGLLSLSGQLAMVFLGVGILLVPLSILLIAMERSHDKREKPSGLN